MPNTYKKVYLHIVFAVRNRNAVLSKSWRPELFSYISGTIKKRGHYPLAVNGYDDHIHILLDYSLNELVPNLVREIKRASTAFIQDNNLTRFEFKWQTGYGIFSVGYKELSIVIQYVIDQEKHHSKKSFKNEYLLLLNKYEIEYKDEYVFEFLDDNLNQR
jgi:REP element-mobilizing transposase RayT